jgi:hypothetical protein
MIADYAWAAGIIDGEGCISILTTKAYPHRNQKTNYRLQVFVGMQHEETIQKLHSIFDLGSMHVLCEPSRQSKIYRVMWTGPTAGKVLELVLPYLVTKREHAQLAMKFLSLPKFKGRRVMKEEQLEARKSCCAEMRRLNGCERVASKKLRCKAYPKR